MKKKTEIFMNANRIFFITFLAFGFNCTKLQFENPCDFSSDEFWKTFLLNKILGEGVSVCSLSVLRYPPPPTPTILADPSGIVTSESLNSVTISVRLSDRPISSVNISAIVSKTTEANVLPTSLQFTEANWDQSQTLTLTGVDDTSFDLTQSYDLNLKSTSIVETYNNMTKTLSFTNLDNEKKIFVTNTTYLGSAVGGISGADAKCNADANKPADNRSYKALLVDNAGCSGVPCRRASVTANLGDGQTDWVIQPNSDYYRTDMTTAIFRSNANGIFIFGNFTNAVTLSAASIWTGIAGNWTTFVGSNCTDWSTDAGSATTGNITLITNSGSLSGASLSCGTARSLLCIQQ